jgi:hypothetical protein
MLFSKEKYARKEKFDPTKGDLNLEGSKRYEMIGFKVSLQVESKDITLTKRI